VFDGLEFVYLPSRDVAADLKHFTDQVGAELVFAIEAFGTRVAIVRLSRTLRRCCWQVISRATSRCSSTAWPT
jgi:hypothetical protein